MDITLRRITENDLEAVDRIEHLSFSVPWTIDDFGDFLRESDESQTDGHGAMLSSHFTAAVTDDGTVAGYICARRVIDEGEILNIAVDPSMRRFGIARRLMTDAIEAMADGGAEAVFLDVRESNTPARRLYESLGFVPIAVRRRYYRVPDEDGIVMTKVISNSEK